MDFQRRIRGWRSQVGDSEAARHIAARIEQLPKHAAVAWRRLRRAARAVSAIAQSKTSSGIRETRRQWASLREELARRAADLDRSLRPAAWRAADLAALHGRRAHAAALPAIGRARAWCRRAISRLRHGLPARLDSVLARLRSWPGSTAAAKGDYRIEVATPLSRYVAMAAAGIAALLIALPAFAGRDLLHDLIFLFTMLALAQCWNLLAGYAGLVSVGQQAFVGLGGYLLFALTIHAGLDALLAILLAGMLAAVLALPTALVVFRLRGAYFAIGTWVMAEVYRLTFAQIKPLGGGTGTSLPPLVTNEVAGIEWVKALFNVRTAAARDIITYWGALLLAAGAILLVYLILRSRHGLALAAIRDSETAAESVGVDNFRARLWVYVVTAAVTGMTGALIYLQKARISPDAAFSVLDWTAYVIFIVVIGGIGTIEGPIVGVLVFYALQTNLAHFGTWYLMLIGAFAIIVMLFAPKGIWGYLAERYDLAIFPIRRRLVRNRPG